MKINVYDYYITPDEYARAERNGIGKNTLDSRIRICGWDKERALAEKPRKRVSRAEDIKIAKQNGITEKAFRMRVERGWSAEEASKIPMKNANEVLERNRGPRKTTDEMLRLAEENNIPRSTFFARVRNGVNMNVAATVKDVRRGYHEILRIY